MEEDQDQVFARQNVTEEQNTKAIDSILYMVCSLTAGQDQATIQAGCAALGQMIRIEQKANTE